MKNTKHTIFRFAAFMLAISLNVLSAEAGTVTFADLAGTADNTPLTSTYGSGLPAGVTATWNGWLLHSNSQITPMSVFPEADLAGNDAEVIFSQPVEVSSVVVLDTGHGSIFSVRGYRNGSIVWQYNGAADGVWHTITNGAGIEIDTLVAEGKWNHVDDILVELPGGVTPPDDPGSGDTVLTLANVDMTLGEVRLDWLGTIGLKDQLQSAVNLTSNTVWQNEGSLLTGVGDTNSITLNMGTDSAKFFRLSSEVIPADEINADVSTATNGLPTPPAGFVWAPIPAYSDEFNGSTLDRSKWDNFHPYWNGREPSRHLPENVSVADGKLRLKNSVIQDPSTVANPSQDVWVGAACITSVDPTALYGYYETKMKASAICMTSAFWFQEGPPQPNSDSEIDVVEQLGVSYNNPYKEYWMQMNTHYYPNGWPNDQSTHTHWNMPTRAREEYHVYGVWWKDATTLWMYHNGVHVATMTPAGPFVDPQYMFFDTEVFHWEGLPTVSNLNNDSLNTMLVDWVRGWQLVPE